MHEKKQLVAAKNSWALAVEIGVFRATQSWMRPAHEPFDIDVWNKSIDAKQAALFLQAVNWLAHDASHALDVESDGPVDRAG